MTLHKGSIPVALWEGNFHGERSFRGSGGPVLHERNQRHTQMVKDLPEASLVSQPAISTFLEKPIQLVPV